MAILHAAVGTHGNMCAQQAPSRIQQQLSTAPKQVRPCGVSGGTIEAAQFLQTALNQHVVPLVRRALSDSSNKVIITRTGTARPKAYLPGREIYKSSSSSSRSPPCSRCSTKSASSSSTSFCIFLASSRSFWYASAGYCMFSIASRFTSSRN